MEACWGCPPSACPLADNGQLETESPVSTLASKPDVSMVGAARVPAVGEQRVPVGRGHKFSSQDSVSALATFCKVWFFWGPRLGAVTEPPGPGQCYIPGSGMPARTASQASVQTAQTAILALTAV